MRWSFCEVESLISNKKGAITLLFRKVNLLIPADFLGNVVDFLGHQPSVVDY
jgi:hypothetical protein